ncbi:hypothetical protein SELMODRAFT_446864 [Selaginella moellendorffii]|uniref:Uncharacterized protein n=1 Tax=Selaginella moellendorffii TaxID=88036 RepID=D8SV02_SELML|nr:hypothetical protein SELMODRAFT_446864 [Selaginella moellendorffii]
MELLFPDLPLRAHDGGVHGMEMAKVPPKGPPQLVNQDGIGHLGYHFFQGVCSSMRGYVPLMLKEGRDEEPCSSGSLHGRLLCSTTYVTGCPARSMPHCSFNCTASASQVDVEDKKVAGVAWRCDGGGGVAVAVCRLPMERPLDC